MTFEQGQTIIALLEYFKEFLEGFAGVYFVELFNVTSFVLIIIAGILLASFLVNSLKREG